MTNKTLDPTDAQDLVASLWANTLARSSHQSGSSSLSAARLNGSSKGRLYLEKSNGSWCPPWPIDPLNVRMKCDVPVTSAAFVTRAHRCADQIGGQGGAIATHYCFGGNRDCGSARCTGLDESCVETCAGCCAGFGSGVWTGLSARGEDESRAVLCWVICSWIRVS